MSQTWTRERVCDAVLAVFRLRTGRAVLTPDQVEAVLHWRRRGLIRDRLDWIYLYDRARVTFEGGSLAGNRRERGWTHHQWETGWRKAADAVAAGLNAEARNSIALEQAMLSEERLEAMGLIPVVQHPPFEMRHKPS